MNKTVSFARHQAVGAYRRWEPRDFGSPPQFPADEPEPVEPESASESEPSISPPSIADASPETNFSPIEAEAETASPSLFLPTAEEIERIHEEARRSGFDEGFDKGLTEGREKGYAEGKETGFREGREAGFSEGKTVARDEARRLHGLAVQIEEALTKLDVEIAEELMSFAVELARKILQHTLAVEPEAVVSAIRAVLHTLPQSRAQIHLNPDDIALVHSHLDEVLTQSEHVLIEDDTVSRGGCRVETPGAQIDATMETRWRRVVESLGREYSPWTPASERRSKTRRASDKPQGTKEAQTKASSTKRSARAGSKRSDAASSGSEDSSSAPSAPDVSPESSQ